jgi:asparagine synthase (glutamine-hydrolysing)
MCGIAGLVDQSRTLQDVEKMLGAIVHRGPDAGMARTLSDGVIFGHRRLSIIDLSESGAQPMVSHNQRWTLTYNGEIYNFQDLKKDLQRNWRGHSDTEILLEAFAEWGVEKTLSRIKGMFAMALLDSHERKLFLIRDRIGEKPLYYGTVGKTFVFASELKAIAQLSGFTGKISTEALAGFFSFSCVPHELSIYEGIFKLLPGNFLELDLAKGSKNIRPYWSIGNFEKKFQIEEQEAIDRLEALLESSVQSQMMADVPLGAFLSGGVDSSTIVAFMQKK